jgi:hypothetical protein
MKPFLSLPGIHFVARRFGWASLRAAAFDAKFLAGEWGRTESPRLVRLVEQYADHRAVLCLGCGTNLLGPMIDREKYLYYLGVDLSIQALRIASKNMPDGAFIRQNMETFDFDHPIDPGVVVFPESIYYVPVDRTVTLLDRWINADTVGIVTIAHPGRYGEYLKQIRRRFEVLIDDPLEVGGERRVIVFRAARLNAQEQ